MVDVRYDRHETRRLGRWQHADVADGQEKCVVKASSTVRDVGASTRGEVATSPRTRPIAISSEVGFEIPSGGRRTIPSAPARTSYASTSSTSTQTRYCRSACSAGLVSHVCLHVASYLGLFSIFKMTRVKKNGSRAFFSPLLETPIAPLTAFVLMAPLSIVWKRPATVVSSPETLLRRRSVSTRQRRPESTEAQSNTHCGRGW